MDEDQAAAVLHLPLRDWTYQKQGLGDSCAAIRKRHQGRPQKTKPVVARRHRLVVYDKGKGYRDRNAVLGGSAAHGTEKPGNEGDIDKQAECNTMSHAEPPI